MVHVLALGVVVVAGGRIGFDPGVDDDLDGDGDGIVDLIDNCPGLPNPFQDNEDGDALGDACDPCPPYADAPVVDIDGDSVSDACDPNPTMVGDRIVVFEGFEHPTASSMTRGTWTFEAGQAKIIGSLDAINILAWSSPGAGAET